MQAKGMDFSKGLTERPMYLFISVLFREKVFEVLKREKV
jgi:hypothetical protein